MRKQLTNLDLQIIMYKMDKISKPVIYKKWMQRSQIIYLNLLFLQL